MSEIVKKLDYDLFEYIIAFNCTFNDLYTTTIIDIVKPEHISNLNIRAYLNIIFDFYRSNQALPTAT
jgi:hypothetical protein